MRDAWSSKIMNVINNKDETKQRRLASLLFIQMNRVNNKDYTRRLKSIYNSDSIEGPIGCALFLDLMALQIDSPKDRIFFLTEKDKCFDDSNNMKKIKRGWSQYGYDDIWWVIHHKTPPQIARYNSEPILKVYYSESSSNETQQGH